MTTLRFKQRQAQQQQKTTKEQNNINILIYQYMITTRLITMRSKPDYVEFVLSVWANMRS